MPIAPGQTQYIRYGNSFLRGHCLSEACVQVSWGSGFFESVKVSNWDACEFLQHPQAARILEGEEAQAAEALFERKAMADGLLAEGVAGVDPALLGLAFLDTIRDPAMKWRERPFSDFSRALAQRLAQRCIEPLQPGRKAPKA